MVFTVVIHVPPQPQTHIRLNSIIWKDGVYRGCPSTTLARSARRKHHLPAINALMMPVELYSRSTRNHLARWCQCLFMLVIHLPPGQRQPSSCNGRSPHGVYRGYPCTTQAAGKENCAPLTAFKVLIVIIHVPPQLQAKIILDHFAALQALMV